MNDPDKTNGANFPPVSMSGHADFQPNELLVLQHLLSEADPGSALWTSALIDPTSLRFIPEASWSSQLLSLQMLHHDYFGRKNNVNRRFEHKLWNALQITTAFPNMVKLVGVAWVSDFVIKVYKRPFAKLLNISAVDGGLFHKQGNFTRHGFVLLSDAEARAKVAQDHIVDVDHREVLLIWHQHAQFTRLASEGTISGCRWDSDAGQAPRVAALRLDAPDTQRH
jgi:hypothetical protein